VTTETLFSIDEGPRADTSLEALAKLKPAFHAQGSVTAGNSSQTSDGAAAVVLMDDERAKELGLRPLARLVSYAVTGCLPEEMGMGPVTAVPKALKRAGLKLDEIDLIELNEAFAAQGLAVLRDLGLADDDARVNPNGGAIALGHPLGASGARLATTAVNQLHRIRGRYALCTMCIGVGQGIALVLERV
jgi:acetyl-CoA acetyltransferase family protein